MLVLAIICIPIGAWAQSSEDWFTKGLESFRWQRNDEAALYFEKAAQANPGRDETFLYLGISLINSRRFENADQAFTRGIDLQGPSLQQLLMYRGNLRNNLGNTQDAAADYDRIVSIGGSMLPSALLNRANLRLQQASYISAVEDYQAYLNAEPAAPQAEDIRRLIALLNGRIQSDAEAARLAAEAARLEEERRLAEAARRAEEEERRAALMREVLQSLSDSGEDTTNIGAGTENIREEFEDSALED